MKNISELQKEIKEFCEKNGMNSPPEHQVLDLISEIGEVAKEILKTSDYGRKPAKYRKEIESELGDALYSLITVANSYNVDLDKSIRTVLDKYKKRLAKGSAGSEND